MYEISDLDIKSVKRAIARYKTGICKPFTVFGSIWKITKLELQHGLDYTNCTIDVKYLELPSESSVYILNVNNDTHVYTFTRSELTVDGILQALMGTIVGKIHES